MARERRLGKGLGSLLGGGKESHQGEVVNIDPDQIVPNPAQPRTNIEPEAMEALIESVSREGILQPIVVRHVGKKYELIAGERRWRAAQHLGLDTIPALIKDVPDDKMLELALVENIQRSDLNPIEKAKAFSQLIREFNLTQELAAERVCMDRSTVANFIRLLDLPADLQALVSRGTLTMGHARALLSCKSQKQQRLLARRIQDQDLSVRDVERLAAKPKAKPKPAKPPHLAELEASLAKSTGLKVAIKPRNQTAGQVVIKYNNLDELDGLIQRLQKPT